LGGKGFLPEKRTASRITKGNDEEKEGKTVQRSRQNGSVTQGRKEQ